jgi:hypothetical protein
VAGCGGDQTVGSLRDEELVALAAGLPELRGIEVESAVPITDAGLVPFFDDPSFASRLTVRCQFALYVRACVRVP